MHCTFGKNYHKIISSIRRWSLISTWCKPTSYQINAGSLINVGAWHNTHMGITAPAINCDKEKSIHCNNAMEVAEKTSREAATKQFDVDPQRI